MFYFGVFYPCQPNGAFYWRSVNDECACASAPLHSRLHKYQSAYSLIEFYVLMNELIFSNEIYIKWLKQKNKKNRQRSMFDDLKKKEEIGTLLSILNSEILCILNKLCKIKPSSLLKRFFFYYFPTLHQFCPFLFLQLLTELWFVDFYSEWWAILAPVQIITFCVDGMKNAYSRSAPNAVGKIASGYKLNKALKYVASALRSRHSIATLPSRAVWGNILCWEFVDLPKDRKETARRV